MSVANNSGTPVFLLPEGFRYANNVSSTFPLYHNRLPVLEPAKANLKPQRRVQNAFQPNAPNNESARRRRANQLQTLRRRYEEARRLPIAATAAKRSRKTRRRQNSHRN